MGVAVIDIGSGSVRMLMDGKKQTVMTKLGEGLNAAGRLSEEAMARTIPVIGGFVGEAERSGHTVYVFATEAVRAAENRRGFATFRITSGDKSINSRLQNTARPCYDGMDICA